MMQKQCKKCDAVKDLDAYDKQKTGKLGRKSTCKDCVGKYERSRYGGDIEGSRDKWRKRYEANKEGLRGYHLVYQAAYKKSNPDKARVWGYFPSQRTRCKAAGVEVSANTQQVKEILALANGKCLYCCNESKLCIDHFVPINKGGGHVVDNLIPCCLSCNSKKRDSEPKEWVVSNFGIKKYHAVMKFLSACIFDNFVKTSTI